MISEKKINFFITQGFDKNVIDLFINCGIYKHLLWFLGAHKKGGIEYMNTEEIKIVNHFLERSKNVSMDLSYPEMLQQAYLFKKDEERKQKNILYTFKNGYYISLLNSNDLIEEGVLMSNCVGGYQKRVLHKAVGILALKQPSGKTVVHIEIKKNGMIGQNYAKANTKMNHSSWMMILEFFNQHSKTVDFSKFFGESYVATNMDGYISEISLSVPTSINISLSNKGKKTEQIQGFEMKRFILLERHKEASVRINSKAEMLDWITQRKQQAIQMYDELYSEITNTSASNLYLSDNIKERIFGSQKGNYLMKGNDYNFSELNETTPTEEGAVRAMEDARLGEMIQAIDRVVRNEDLAAAPREEIFGNRPVNLNAEIPRARAREILQIQEVEEIPVDAEVLEQGYDIGDENIVVEGNADVPADFPMNEVAQPADFDTILRRARRH